MCTSVPLGEQCISSYWENNKMYISSTIANSQKMCTFWNEQRLCYWQSNNFSGASDTVRHLKTFTIISNEKSILLLILCQ